MFQVSLGLLGSINIFTLLIGLVIVFALFWIVKASQ